MTYTIGRIVPLLEQFSAEQERLVKYREEKRQRDNYDRALELLKDLFERDDFRCSMSVEDTKRVQDVLREGGWL